MWLATAYPGKKLEKLNNQFIVGDSLDSFDWVMEFKEIFKINDGFDLVIGNPPYIRTQNLNRDTAERYKKNYEVASKGNFDIYNLFIELGSKIINPSGEVSFILPHKFFVVDSGEPLRNFLLKNKLIDKIFNLNQIQVFENATTYTCMIFLSKKNKNSFDYFSVESLENMDTPKKEKILFESLTTSKWEFGSLRTKNILDKVRINKLQLKDISPKIFQGIATSADSIFILEIQNEDTKYVWAKSKEHNKIIKIEKSITLPVLKGSEITSFILANARYCVIFPYIVDGDKYKPIPIEVMKSSFPETYKYLKSNYQKLLIRSKTDESNWWLYPYPKNITYYKKPKIILQVLSNQAQFGLDSKGHFCFVGGGTAGGNAILIDDLSHSETLLMVGILNSSLTTFYIKHTSSSFKGGYFSFGKSSISSLPIPEFSKINTELKDELLVIVKSLMKKNCKEAFQKLNNIVFKIYGLSKTESNDILKDIEVTAPVGKNKKKAA